VAVEGPPEPHALLAVHALPIETLAGWQTSGAGLLGIPFGRFMALAGDSLLDLRVDVPGDGREKRFGLASKAVRALIVELQDRVTTPLLAAAEEHDEDDGHILILPVVSVDADAGDPAPAGGDLVDRTAVLLAQFRELSVRLDGRAAPDEPMETGMLRARRVEAYLRTLGLGDRVEIGPPSLGTPGVVIVIRGAARSG